jgi:hypothetical protein
MSLDKILEKLFGSPMTGPKNIIAIKTDLSQRIMLMAWDVPKDSTSGVWISKIYNDIITFYNDIVEEFEDHDAMFMEELDRYVLDIPLTRNIIIMYCAAILHVQNKLMKIN